MSHDRGCFRCYEDHPRHAAKTCTISDCPYKEEKEMTGVTQKIADAKSASANSRQVGGEHYKTAGGIEHWDLFGPDYLVGYATKYMRWRKKGGVQDLEKAIHVVEKLREVISEAMMPKYDVQMVSAWMDAVGLDWVERMIVHRIMFCRGPSDLDEACRGLKYLIENNNALTKVTRGLDTERRVPRYQNNLSSFNLGAGTVESGKLAWYRATDSHIETVVRVIEILQDGDAIVDLSGARKTVKWATLRPYEPMNEVERPRTPADGAQHASLFPWVMTHKKFDETFEGRVKDADPFYRSMGREHFRLETYVEHGALPRELQSCYTIVTNTQDGPSFWLLRIEQVPPDLRDHYPRVQREMNSKEYDEAPRWQKALYLWSKDHQKWILRYEAWGRDA